MAGNPSPPDYVLADRIALTEPSQVKAISHPVRTTILGLLHERAASVKELAVAVERPKSTVAHHVKVLAEAGLVQVVRTQRVRAVDERLYGRTARMFYVGVERSSHGGELPPDFNDFEVDVAQDLVPNHPTLGDVDSPEALEAYQEKKRAHKAEMRAKQQA